jgi:uncharacterized protein (DUF362 family)
MSLILVYFPVEHDKVTSYGDGGLQVEDTAMNTPRQKPPVVIGLRLPMPDAVALDTVVAKLQSANPRHVVSRPAVIRRALQEFLAQHAA